MYYNKKRTKTVALLGVVLLLGVCGCDAEEPVQEEQKQESVAGTVTEAVVQEPAEITQPVTEGAEGTTKEAEPTAVVEEEPEGQILRLLTEAEDLYFTSGGVLETEILGYVIETDASYFIMKKQNDHGLRGEELYIGSVNPETGELIQCNTYGGTTTDAAMKETEKGNYILYVTEYNDFGLHGGSGGVLLAKDGTLTPVWPLTPEGTYDEAYWIQHIAKLNGETLELDIHKVIITEVSPGETAIRTEIELERTITLDEILAGAV